MKRFWSEDKVNTLTKLYPTHTSRQIADILGTSRLAVYVQANKIGLHKEQPCKINLTDEQKQWLKRNYPHMANDICAVYLGISRRSVVRLARDLELEKTPQFMRECQAHTAKKAKESHLRNGTYPAKGWYSPNLQKGKFINSSLIIINL